MKITNKWDETFEVNVGDWVGFKSDIEQSGKVKQIQSRGAFIVENKNDILKIEMPNGQKVILQIKIGEPMIESSYYAPKFGKKVNSKYLKVALEKKKGSCVKISWDNFDE